VSQIDKQNMWKQITIIIHQEHPECPEKTVDVVKKKGKILQQQQGLPSGIIMPV
jgi:hypothetical protein